MKQNVTQKKNDSEISEALKRIARRLPVKVQISANIKRQFGDFGGPKKAAPGWAAVWQNLKKPQIFPYRT